MKKYGPHLLALYLVFHIWISLFGIRIWPLTDYPMFGEAFPFFEEVEAFRYRLVFKNGETQWAKRSVGNQFGIYKGRDFSKQKEKLKKWEDELRQSVIEQYPNYSQIEKFQLVKRRALRIGQTHQFEIQNRVEHEFDL